MTICLSLIDLDVTCIRCQHGHHVKYMYMHIHIHAVHETTIDLHGQPPLTSLVCKFKLAPDLTSTSIASSFLAFVAKIRGEFPYCNWIYVCRTRQYYYWIYYYWIYGVWILKYGRFWLDKISPNPCITEVFSRINFRPCGKDHHSIPPVGSMEALIRGRAREEQVSKTSQFK